MTAAVDTNTFRGQGFATREVPGACFCCRFDDLIDRVGSLETAERPDVILAEPVGSCTDLVATVVQPLKDLYGGRFEVARDILTPVAADSSVKSAGRLWAAIAVVVTDLALGNWSHAEVPLEEIALSAELDELPWLARIARGLQAAVLLATRPGRAPFMRPDPSASPDRARPTT